MGRVKKCDSKHFEKYSQTERFFLKNLKSFIILASNTTLAQNYYNTNMKNS